MTTLVLTLVGDDRAGIVAAVATIVDAAGGNWESSQLAELAGAFAGIVEVSVPDERADELREALSGMDGLVTVTTVAAASAAHAPARHIALQVLGNDHPGIVREITAALSTHGLSIDRMTTEVRDAAMSGGRLFEASIEARVPAGLDVDDVRGELERVAAEIQVDLTVS
ncbi:amino acid-binding ACT protein [Microbacterium lushaniae]|nr:amino acid-binding ACT protein [Microbacterium lushaniae]KAA9157855.1 amino acid-binding ACT protein [Microbacterium lushaniae]